MYNNRRGCVQGDCIRIILCSFFVVVPNIEVSFPRRRNKTLERITKQAQAPPPEARLLPGKELMTCSVLSACKVCEYSVDERCANYRSAEINMKQQTIRLFLVLVLAEQGSGNQIFNWTSPTLGITVAQTRGNTTCIMSRGMVVVRRVPGPTAARCSRCRRLQPCGRPGSRRRAAGPMGRRETSIR